MRTLWVVGFAIFLTAFSNRAIGKCEVRCAWDESASDREITATEQFERYHPDIKYRRRGLYAYSNKQYDEARKNFLRAARYADKPSQAMLAEMFWSGEGGESDRILAYIWMDITAERGAPLFLARREYFWMQLNKEQRKRVVPEGRRLYREFGDEHAKPRLERNLRRGLKAITGSHVGRPSPGLLIEIPGPSGNPWLITGERMYSDRYWRPEEYWAWQNKIWNSATPKGRVEIGPMTPIKIESDK